MEINLTFHTIYGVGVRPNVFINADSGYLGLSYRRRTHKTANLVGELSRSFDPAVSEWENPSCFIAAYVFGKMIVAIQTISNYRGYLPN